MDLAELSGTFLYCGRRNHPRHGWIDVLGYQNTVVNLASGPNAMLLHLPARRMTSSQFVPVGDCDAFLRDMVEAVRPRSRGMAAVASVMTDTDSVTVEVFDHDIYTVVLASDARAVPGALEQVEPRKRPALNAALFEFYAAQFPDYPIAVCCFDNAEAEQAKPLLLWYEPLDDARLVVPALDCHSGAVPDLDAEVDVDHWVLFGTDATELPSWGAPVAYSQTPAPELREFLPACVVGRYYGGRMPNGDFAIAHADLVRGDLDRVERVRPPGAGRIQPV